MLALFVALGGGALAAKSFVSSNGQIHGCVDKKGHLTLVKAGKKCGKGKSKIVWSQKGVPGQQGVPGQPGRPGADLTNNCQGNDANDVMVKAGPVCIDRYEASVWSSPTGGTQYGVSSANYPCNANGNDCKGRIYARSVAGVTPSGYITWFQAQQALANSGKRLPTSADWQLAAAGTPDPGVSPGPQDCNTTTNPPAATGSRGNCVSAWGANDMVGNLWEWVADWVPASTGNPGWGTFSDDYMGLSGASTTAQGPGALVRGGNFFSGFGGGTQAGVLAIDGQNRPTDAGLGLGLRGVR